MDTRKKDTSPTRNLILLLLTLSVAAAYLFYTRYNSDPVPGVDRYKLSINSLPQSSVLDSEFIEDNAKVLGPFSRYLDDVAKQWKRDFGIELQIITLDGGDQKIEVLANALFRNRQIGKASETGGMLILIDSANQKARIEVSYSLEGLFTDAQLGLLAKDQLAPYASYRAVGMAIMDVLHYLGDYTLEQTLAGNFVLEEKYTLTEAYQSKKRFYSGGGGAQTAIPDVPTDRDFKATVPTAKRALYQPGTGPEETIDAYKRSIRDYVGDPDLELFTEGSQEMRKRYPFAPYEELTRLRRIVASEPLRIVRKENYAVALSDQPVHGFSPILMKNIGGKWRVDIAETWKNLFFDGNGRYFLKNKNTPYYFGLRHLGKGSDNDIAPLPVPDGELRELVAQLEKRNDALAKFRLAELLFRNAFAAIDALAYYEQALKLAPNDPLFLSTYADRVLYLGFAELAIAPLKTMGPGKVNKLAKVYGQLDQFENAEFVARSGLVRNPYNRYGLRVLGRVLEKQNKQKEAKEIAERLTALERDETKKWKRVKLRFYPERPVYHTKQPVKVGKNTVYGYSNFAIEVSNPSNRPVMIDSIILSSLGTGASSGLGDIKHYWKYPSGSTVLKPGERVWVSRFWGFGKDSRHQRVSYKFDVCWTGTGDTVKQCRTKYLHLVSDQNVLWTTKLTPSQKGMSGYWYRSQTEYPLRVVELKQTGDSIEGKYIQKGFTKGSQYSVGETILRGRIEGKNLVGKILIKWSDYIKQICPDVKYGWVPIKMSMTAHGNRLSGRYPGQFIRYKPGGTDCTLEPMKRDMILDRL